MKAAKNDKKPTPKRRHKTTPQPLANSGRPPSATMRRERDENAPGETLVRAIEVKAFADGLTNKDLAERLGITQTDVSRIRRGYLDLSLLSRERLETIAEYLSISPLAAMLLSGQVVATDFYRASGDDLDSLEDRIERATSIMVEDPEWGGIMPAGLLGKLSLNDRLYLIWCYEKATGRILVPGAMDYLAHIKEAENKPTAAKNKKATARR